MTKKSKRILAVIILILIVLLVGYVVFTSNRLASYPKDISEYERMIFEGEEDTMVVFTENGAWYGAGGGEIILLEQKSYEEGVITMVKNNKKYRFVAIGRNALYDENSKRILVRRTIDDDFT